MMLIKNNTSIKPKNERVASNSVLGFKKPVKQGFVVLRLEFHVPCVVLELHRRLSRQVLHPVTLLLLYFFTINRVSALSQDRNKSEQKTTQEKASAQISHRKKSLPCFGNNCNGSGREKKGKKKKTREEEKKWERQQKKGAGFYIYREGGDRRLMCQISVEGMVDGSM